MSGYFSSNPYKDEDWSGRGRVTYYMNLEPDVMIHPDYLPILTTNELINAIPSFDWMGGHSGRLLDEKSAVKLESLWKTFTEKNEDVPKIHAFRQEVDPSDYVNDASNTLFCYLYITEKGKVGVYNTQNSFDSIEEAEKNAIETYEEYISRGFKVEFKFVGISDDNQERFFSLIPHLLQLDIPTKYYKLINQQNSDDEIATVVLYCLVKYGNETLSSLLEQGLPSNIIDAVMALLPVDGETDEQQINRIARNEIATSIKKDELYDELDINKLEQISIDDVPRLNKAIKALKQLRKQDKR